MMRKLIVFMLAMICSGQMTFANEQVEACKRIASDAKRLQCYDHLFLNNQYISSSIIAEYDAPASILDYIWDLKGDKLPRFAFSSYLPNYILPARYVERPNTTPSTPTHPASIASKLDPTEVAYQLSFKNKLWQDIPLIGGSLWFAYTQNSYWQLYNTAQSSPFRETDYAPQAVLSIPTRQSWQLEKAPFGMQWKVTNIGLLHQSNGQSGNLSRSWNRLYAEFGLENQHMAVLIRPWARLPEGSNDDNPDIMRYMGYGDMRMIYRYGKQIVSFLGRFSPSGRRGAIQLDYVFPLSGQLQGYFQAFSGYGNSLIDYNRHQNVVGIGVLIRPWKESDSDL